MTFFAKYLYFFGSLIAIVIFFIIFYYRKDLRGRMLKIGLCTALMAILLENAFFQDYWRPPLILSLRYFGGIEDLLFGFAAGGIGTTLYAVVFHKSYYKKERSRPWIIPLAIFSEFLAMGILFYGFRINSIYASSIGFIVPAILIVFIRRDLFIETITSAFLGGFLLVFIEILVLLLVPTYLKSYYLLYGKTPLVFGIAPITEFLWGASFSSIVGPILDFANGNVPG